MNVKYLESFLEVAKDLNMTTAAQRLYISQQTLSFQIQRLELYYGVKMCIRDSHSFIRGSVPSDTGQVQQCLLSVK